MIIENLEDAFNKTIEATILYGTANHYIFDKLVEQQIMPDDVIDRVAATLDNVFMSQLISADPVTKRDSIVKKLREVRGAFNQEDRRKSIREHVAKRCLNAIKAVWAVEKKSVTDNMMKNIRDLAILERNAWIDATLLVSREIVAHAYEDDDVGEQRANAVQTIANMKEVLSELKVMAEANSEIEVNGANAASVVTSSASESEER